MSENKDGGFVYPRTIKENSDVAGRSGRESQEFSYPGISRRDWLAGLAMQGMAADSEFGGSDKDMAVYAYKIADAMIAEGNK